MKLTVSLQLFVVPDDIQILVGPLPGCVPESCVCEDGSEVPLPPLPDRITTQINRVLETITSKIAGKLVQVCEGEEPSKCKCENAFLGELIDPIQNSNDLRLCQPKQCYCPTSDEWVKIHPAKILFNTISENICHLSERMPPNFRPFHFDELYFPLFFSQAMELLLCSVSQKRKSRFLNALALMDQQFCPHFQLSNSKLASQKIVNVQMTKS